VLWTATTVDHTSSAGGHATVVPIVAWFCADSGLCDKGCLIPAISCTHKDPAGTAGFAWPTVSDSLDLARIDLKTNQ
jgi:hypothetical protein